MTPAEIAARLTPAQRRALCILPADGAPAIWTGRGEANWNRRGWKWNIAAVLRRHGLICQWVPLSALSHEIHPEARVAVDCYALSELGQAVRAIIEQEDSRG